MKPEKQIKALAELDGWIGVQLNPRDGMIGMCEGGKHERFEICKPYLTSYDATIPLIQHQDEIIKSEVVENLYLMGDRQLDRTPSQLCEALLKSIGKWKK